MEFHEKLQELRKNKNLTQEELAECLFVSRTAISKWESGRGYPNIDSLKQIAKYFDITIDELLSSERLLSLAEEENLMNLINMCQFMFGVVDISTVLLILLPLYPFQIHNYIYSVNLLEYRSNSSVLYWILYFILIGLGVLKVLLRNKKELKYFNELSILMSVVLVLYLALTRQSYATSFAFILLLFKFVLLFKQRKL